MRWFFPLRCITSHRWVLFINTALALRLFLRDSRHPVWIACMTACMTKIVPRYQSYQWVITNHFSELVAFSTRRKWKIFSSITLIISIQERPPFYKLKSHICDYNLAKTNALNIPLHPVCPLPHFLLSRINLNACSQQKCVRHKDST